MELVAKVMNPKHKMSKKDVIAAYNEAVILSLHCEAEQCPKPLFFGSSFVVAFNSHINRKKTYLSTCGTPCTGYWRDQCTLELSL